MNPEWQAKVQKECQSFGDQIFYEEVTPTVMPYLNATIKETLRFQTSVPVYPRSSLQDVVLFGKYKIPATSFVWTSPHLLGRDPKNFFQAEKFLPERWIEPIEPQYSQDNHNAFLPFGYGSRSCIGSRMAFLEAQIVLCKILQRYTIKPPPSSYIFELEEGMTIRPKYGMPLTLRRKEK